MPTFNITFTNVVNATISVDVPEGSDYQDAIEAAEHKRSATMGGLCNQCQGWAQPWGREEGDEWEPVYVSDEDGETVWSDFPNEREATR